MDSHCFICKPLKYHELIMNSKCNIMKYKHTPETWKDSVNKIIPLIGTCVIGIAPQILNTYNIFYI